MTDIENEDELILFEEDLVRFDNIKEENTTDKIKTILAIDIGMTNLAMFKEKVNITKLGKIKNISKFSRYTSNGECTEEFQEVLNKLYLCGKKTWIDKIDVTDDNEDKFITSTVKIKKTKSKQIRKRRIINNKMLLRLTDYLKKLKDNKVFDDVDIIVIEKQMKTNPSAQEVQFHIRAFFLFWYRLEKEIILFPSKYKTQVLGAPKKLLSSKNVFGKMTKYQRKKWAVELANEILSLRKDKETLDFIFIENKSKKDDLSDTLLHSIAFSYLRYIDGSFKED